VTEAFETETTKTLKFADEPFGVTVTCGTLINVFVNEYVIRSEPLKEASAVSIVTISSMM
jgi:hypothetical protein